MCRESLVLFMVVANATMGLGAFVSVTLGNPSLLQLLLGAFVGFLFAIPIHQVIMSIGYGDEAAEERPDWFLIDEPSEIV